MKAKGKGRKENGRREREKEKGRGEETKMGSLSQETSIAKMAGLYRCQMGWREGSSARYLGCRVQGKRLDMPTRRAL